MDQLRQLRFIVAPLFLFVSLLIWALLVSDLYFQGSVLKFKDIELKAENLAAVGGIIAAVVLPVGFIVGGLSTILLRLWFGITCQGHYEVGLREDTWSRIWPVVTRVPYTRTGKDYSDEVYCVTTFQTDKLSDGVQAWIDRRWNSFNAYINCCTVLGFSVVLGRILFKFPNSPLWNIFASISFGLLLWLAYTIWHEVMEMFEFQARRDFSNETK